VTRHPSSDPLITALALCALLVVVLSAAVEVVACLGYDLP
jgi:hypothetical protein